MKLTGGLKKRVEKANTREAARQTIASAGMLLNDDALDQVAGGWPGETIPTIFDGKSSDHLCACGEPQFFQSGWGWYCPKCDKPKK